MGKGSITHELTEDAHDNQIEYAIGNTQST
jgi:hypothetical protein